MSLIDKIEQSIESGFTKIFSHFNTKNISPDDIVPEIIIKLEKESVTNDHGKITVGNSITVTLSREVFDKVLAYGGNDFVDQVKAKVENIIKKKGYKIGGSEFVIKIDENADYESDKFKIDIEFEEPIAEKVSGKPMYSTKNKESAKVALDSNALDVAKAPESTPKPAPSEIADTAFPPAPVENEVSDASSHTTPHPVLNINGISYELLKPKTSLGRDSLADISLREDKAISSKHLEFVIDGNQVIVSDLNSTNGLFVEGNKTSKALLQNGNTITIGKSTTIVYNWS